MSVRRRHFGAPLLAAAWLLCAALPLAAHEFWVTPSRWQVAPGAPITVLANVGDQFPRANSFTTPDRIQSIRIVGPAGDHVLAPPFRREGDSLAADGVAPSAAGVYIGVVVVKPRVGEKSGSVFQAHIAHQGLDDVAEDRAKRGETDRPVRERYSRYGKTLVRVGGGGDATHVTRPAGLKIELVPLSDPTALTVGAPLRLRLLLDGQPAPNALVGGIYATANARPEEWPLRARTDARGEVEFRLTHKGPWLFRAVRTVRCEGERGDLAADWESFWASLTFDLQ